MLSYSIDELGALADRVRQLEAQIASTQRIQVAEDNVATSTLVAAVNQYEQIFATELRRIEDSMESLSRMVRSASYRYWNADLLLARIGRS